MKRATAIALLLLAALAPGPALAQEQPLIHVTMQAPAPGLARPIITVNGLLPPGGAQLNLTLSIVTRAGLECRLESPILAGYLPALYARTVRSSLTVHYSNGTVNVEGWLLVETPQGRINFTRVTGTLGPHGASITLGGAKGNGSVGGLAMKLRTLLSKSPLRIEYNETAIIITANNSITLQPPAREASLQLRLNASSQGSLLLECHGAATGDPAAQATWLGGQIARALGLPYNLSLATPVYLRAYTSQNGSVIIELPAVDLEATRPGITLDALASDIARGIRSRLGDNATIEVTVAAPGALPSNETGSPAGTAGTAPPGEAPQGGGEEGLVLAAAGAVMALVAVLLVYRLRRG